LSAKERWDEGCQALGGGTGNIGEGERSSGVDCPLVLWYRGLDDEEYDRIWPDKRPWLSWEAEASEGDLDRVATRGGDCTPNS
jgi:hypothetical protein